MSEAQSFGQKVTWEPATPRIGLLSALLAAVVAAVSLLLAALLLPGMTIEGLGAAFGVAVVIAVINAILPPLLAALRLPFMVGIGFLLVLFANAAALKIASDIAPDAMHVDGFTDALL